MVSVVLNISILLLPISLYLISICYQNNVKVINKNILSFILVILQLVINFNSSRIFSLIVIVIYIGIMIGYFRIKKRGINNG